MSVLRHPNIVMFLGACSNPPCMITEYCARGSLLDILTRARDCPVSARAHSLALLACPDSIGAAVRCAEPSAGIPAHMNGKLRIKL